MADEEATANITAKADKDVGSSQLGTFDPTKKKKKKKKERVGEEDVDVQEEVAAVAEGVSQLSVNENGESAGDGGLDFGKKKKKKKPQASKEGEGEDGAEGAEEDGDATAAEGGEGMELSLEKKKKKKKKQRAEGDELPGEEGEDGKGESKGEDEEGAKEAEEEEEGDEQGDDDEEAEGIDLGPPKMPWEGTDRDYLYEELLGRVFNILRQNNPELAGDRRRTIMRPPQVLREGTKKTVFVNFMDLCKIMHRQPEHVMAFLLVELGTSGSLDGQQRLVVKGRFAPKNFEGILRRYVNEYLMCNGCKSPDTILSKENRLFFLRCEQCGSHRSVAPIKAGFVAQVGKRVKTG